MFDKLVLLAPYPPPSMDDRTCAERIASFVNAADIWAIGAEKDEHACTQEAHPVFWEYLVRAGMRPWFMAQCDHKATKRKSY